MSVATDTHQSSRDDTPRYWGPGHDAPQHLRRFVQAIFRIGFTVQSSGCWEYDGARNRGGYGIVTVKGEGTRRAHRVMYEYIHGPFPEGKPFALHNCANPSCINPTHLRAGDHAENMEDMVRHGHNPGAKERCRNGHEYTPENTAWREHDGYRARRCLVCTAQQERRRAARRKRKQ